MEESPVKPPLLPNDKSYAPAQPVALGSMQEALSGHVHAHIHRCAHTCALAQAAGQAQQPMGSANLCVLQHLCRAFAGPGVLTGAVSTQGFAMKAGA